MSSKRKSQNMMVLNVVQPDQLSVARSKEHVLSSNCSKSSLGTSAAAIAHTDRAVGLAPTPADKPATQSRPQVRYVSSITANSHHLYQVNTSTEHGVHYGRHSTFG